MTLLFLFICVFYSNFIAQFLFDNLLLFLTIKEIA